MTNSSFLASIVTVLACSCASNPSSNPIYGKDLVVYLNKTDYNGIKEKRIEGANRASRLTLDSAFWAFIKRKSLKRFYKPIFAEYGDPIRSQALQSAFEERIASAEDRGGAGIVLRVKEFRRELTLEIGLEVHGLAACPMLISRAREEMEAGDLSASEVSLDMAKTALRATGAERDRLEKELAYTQLAIDVAQDDSSGRVMSLVKLVKYELDLQSKEARLEQCAALADWVGENEDYEEGVRLRKLVLSALDSARNPVDPRTQSVTYVSPEVRAASERAYAWEDDPVWRAQQEAWRADDDYIMEHAGAIGAVVGPIEWRDRRDDD